MAAAIAAAGRSGEFDVDDILKELGEDVYETPSASAYATPMTSPAPTLSAAAAKAQVAAAKAAVERAVAARTPEAVTISPKSPSGVAGRFSNPPSPSPLRIPEGSPEKATPPSSPNRRASPERRETPKRAAESPPPPAASPPASPGAVSLSLSTAEEPSNPAGGLPATPRASSSLGDEMLKMAFERSHAAEAAVAALFGRRARDEGRRALWSWNLATARSRVDRLEDELTRLRFALAEAEANAEAAAEAEAEAEASSPSPPAKKNSETPFGSASFASKKSPITSADSPEMVDGEKAPRSFANPLETGEKAPAVWSEPAATVSPAPAAAARIASGEDGVARARHRGEDRLAGITSAASGAGRVGRGEEETARVRLRDHVELRWRCSLFDPGHPPSSFFFGDVNFEGAQIVHPSCAVRLGSTGSESPWVREP